MLHSKVQILEKKTSIVLENVWRIWTGLCFHCRLYSEYYFSFGKLNRISDLSPRTFHDFVTNVVEVFSYCCKKRSVRQCVYNGKLFGPKTKSVSRENTGNNQVISSCLGYYHIPRTLLTLSQTTNFELFQTERVCRRQFQVL